MIRTGRTSIPVRCLDLSPLFATLTQTAKCVPEIPILELTTVTGLPRPCRGHESRFCRNRYLSGRRASNVLLEAAESSRQTILRSQFRRIPLRGGCDG
jgi:hypothetical protein